MAEHYKEWIPVQVKLLRGSRTLREIADATGLSISYLSDIERGRTSPSIETLDKIFTACGVTLTLGYQQDYVPPEYMYIKRKDAEELQALCKRILGTDTD